MAHEMTHEQRERLIFQISQWLNFSSDEWLTEVMKGVSADYAKGYLEGFIAKAGEDDIRMFYQFVRIINMA